MRFLAIVFALMLSSFNGSVPASADCICLNRGVEVVEGKTACVKTANGPKLALCEKNLNMTTWKFLGEECPVAALDLQKVEHEQTAALKTN